jgi:fatty acid desaturase
MNARIPPQIELLPDGSFRPQQTPLSVRIFRWAVIIAALAGSLALAAFALWIVLLLIPVMLVAGIVAWLAFRYQTWRAGDRPRWR